MLAERAVQNATEVERAYGGGAGASRYTAPPIISLVLTNFSSADAEEWGGVGSGSGSESEREEEYEGEEQLATVTVVEDFDPATLIYGPEPTRVPPVPTDAPKPPRTTGRVKPKDMPGKIAKAKAGKRSKDVKYQTQAGRRADKRKQLARHTEKAERAGGKQSRKRPNARRSGGGK
jgi:ribosomal RNA-processing protein 17